MVTNFSGLKKDCICSMPSISALIVGHGHLASNARAEDVEFLGKRFQVGNIYLDTGRAKSLEETESTILHLGNDRQYLCRRIRLCEAERIAEKKRGSTAPLIIQPARCDTLLKHAQQYRIVICVIQSDVHFSTTYVEIRVQAAFFGAIRYGIV
nr:MAG TPA: PTS system mannose-specific transporter subunit, mannose transporter, transferase.8A [Caudoviricetes sp.]